MAPFPKLITFDCYGTLIDWYGGLEATLRRLGVSEPDLPRVSDRYVFHEASIEAGPYLPYREVMRRALRRTLEELDRPVLPGDGGDAGYYDELGRSLPDWDPFPEVPAVLQELALRAPLAILSNIDDDLLDASVRRLGAPIRHRVTAEAVRSYKPAPVHFQRIFQITGLERGEVLHVAASLMHDQEPCRELGIPTIWIDRRGEHRPEWLPPERVLPDLRRLVEVAFP